MNRKAILGILLAALVLTGGYALTRPKTLPALVPTDNSINALASSTGPSFKFGTTTKTTTQAYALFDAVSFTSSSTYPALTGTANVSKVGIIIYDSKNLGLVGTPNVSVEKGHWTYYSSVALPPGLYSVLLLGGATNAVARLIITNP